MAKQTIKPSVDIDYLFQLAEDAWALSEDQINSIKPGSEGADQVLKLLDVGLPADRFLMPKTRFDLENPHKHILQIMSDPDFFPFTCTTLFNRPDGSGPLNILPFQQLTLKELWWRQFPMILFSRGAGKTMILGLYALLRATFTPGAKIIITGSGFRQSKMVFEYMERIWHNSPVFRSLVNSRIGGRKNGPRRDIDKVEFVIGDSIITGIPIGDGEKVRGLRANYILSDEFASINELVYAVVIQGFASVTADPIGNVKDSARMRLLKRLGLWNKEMDEEEAKKLRGNQSVISGTASYAFNHFYRYYKDYKAFIETGGDENKLKALFGGEIPADFKWNSYSIMRLPYTLIPHGFMDNQTIARAKRITNTSEFAREYEAVFIKDSDGFYRRSLIESCVVGSTKESIEFPSCGRVEFTASLTGHPNLSRCKYIYGIDPASESDQFALVILELWEDHRRVVYTWTTSKSKQKQQIKKKLTKENNFYKYAVQKIRSLFKDFPPERILVDKGGGGIALREAFMDDDKLQKGDLPVYEIRDPDPKNRKYTDDLPGLHILEIVQFASEWIMEANEGMKKDMEDKILLFPLIDSLALGVAGARDELEGRKGKNEDGEMVYLTQDTLEQNMLEIEKLKDELATIVVTQTPTGVRRWDTPDHKVPGSKAGRLRKDRYSALLLANMGARILQRANPGFKYDGLPNGGFVNELVLPHKQREVQTGNLYQGPLWFKNKVNNGYYGALVRRD